MPSTPPTPEPPEGPVDVGAARGESSPRIAPARSRASRSGADTPRSTDVVKHGGKVDPDALLRRIASGAGETDEGTPAETVGEGADDRVVAAPGADDDALNRVVFVLQRDLQKRLDKYLTDRIPFMSRTQLQRLVDEGGVTVNGRPPKASTKLRINDRVEVFIPPPPPSEVQPEDIPLEVLFEDEHLIVLNKRPDIIVHPARSHNRGTLINALAYHFRHRSAAGGALSTVGQEFARPGVVHRLDRHTSGLIVFAKDDTSHWRLARQFETRVVDKRYLALVHGAVEPEVDVIDLPIGPHPSREKGYREKYVVRHDVLGKPSVTICRVRARFAIASTAAAYSLVELELKTGRTHQIRVHLSHGGYPIVGDDMYGGRELRAGDLGDAAPDAAERVLISRQALHAATLGFRHPMTQQPMSFTAPLPDDMATALAGLLAGDPSARALNPPGATVNLAALVPG